MAEKSVFVKIDNVNDESYKVTGVNFKNGDPVQMGDVIGSFETSKTTGDIYTENSGYVFYMAKLGATVNFKSKFAIISDNPNFTIDIYNKEPINEQNSSEIRISRLAQKLIEEYNIDISVFKGKQIIGKDDVELFLNENINKADNTTQFKGNDIIIVYGGRHSKMCIDILRQTNHYNIIGILDDNYSKGTIINEVEVIGNLSELDHFFTIGVKTAILGLGSIDDNTQRHSIYNKIKEVGFYIPNLIHPKAILEASVKLGQGNQIMAGAVVGSCAVIGDNCIINSGSIVSHDCVIGNNVHIAPGAILAGTVRVNENSLIGMGVTIFYEVTIGSNVVINNGINIFADIPSNSIIR